MVSDLSYFCGMAATAFIAVQLTAAAVRWFHLCRPYDRDPGYNYPGRPFVTAIGLCALFLLPFAWAPESVDAWYLARLYLLPVTLLQFAILLFSYFGNLMQWRQWRIPTLIVGIPMLLALLAALVLALWPGEQIGSGIAEPVARSIIFVLGAIITVVCIVSITVVYRWARQFDEDDFSNPGDFPVHAARRWLVMVLVNGAFCWSAALSGSRTGVGVLLLLLAASMVVFLITVLHPHRNQPPQAPKPAAAPVPEPVPTQEPGGIPEARWLSILDAIHTVVIEQEAYLDPHLTLQDVSDRCGYNRSYISSIIKAEYGGFFKFVNGLRVQHVASYLAQNPGATTQEAVRESGFNSRQAYYAVKARLENGADGPNKQSQ